MIDFIRKHKWLLLVLLITLLVVIPVVIGFIYSGMNDPIPSGDLLNYYGAALSFIGTSFLSLLALYQTDIIQKKESEKEELLRKQEIERNQPRFRIKKINSDSKLTVVKCEIVNLSENVAYKVSVGKTNLFRDNSLVQTIDSVFSASAMQSAESSVFELKIDNEFDEIRASLTYVDKYETEHEMVAIGKRIDKEIDFTVKSSIGIDA